MRYIAFEGADGAGTTTICAKVAMRLEQQGSRVHRIMEPSNGEVGQLIRKYLSNGAYQTGYLCDQFTLAHLFWADRFQQLRAVNEMLHTRPDHRGPPQPDFIVSDRCHLSTAIYQQMTATPEEHRRLTDALPLAPDTLIVLHAPVPVLEARLDRRGDRDMMEEKAHLKHVHKLYSDEALVLRYLSEATSHVYNVSTTWDTPDGAVDECLRLIHGESLIEGG